MRTSPVDEVAFDSRRVVRGALFFCVRGATADGHDFARGGGSSGSRRPRRRALARPRRSPDPRPVRATVDGADVGGRVRRAGALDDDRRRHRHERQDHRRPSARRGVPRRRAPDRRDRHGRRARGRRGSADRANHARGARPPPTARADAGRRRHGGRDGGVVARARSGACRRCVVRRRRSSPTSRRTTWTTTGRWRRTSRRRRRCSPRIEPSRPSSTSTTPWGRRLLDVAVPVTTFGLDPAADVHAEDVRASTDGLAFRVDEREVRSPLRGGFNVSNCLAAIAVLGARRRRSGPTRSAGWRAPDGCPGAWSRSMRGRDSWWWWTTRTRRIASEQCLPRHARWRRAG